MRPSLAVHLFRKEIPWRHHKCFANLLHVEGICEIGTESADFGDWTREKEARL